MSIKQDIFYNKTINKKELKSIVHSTFQSYGIIKATNLAEKLKKTGFAFATQAGISISIEDLKVPPTKDTLFAKNNTQININDILVGIRRELFKEGKIFDKK